MYPKFKTSYKKDELIEYFTITPNEINIMKSLKKSKELGFAVLLKTFIYLGYIPKNKSEVPKIIIDFVAKQLSLDTVSFDTYQWRNRNWKYHVGIIRKYTGFRSFKNEDKNQILHYLLKQDYTDINKKLLINISINKCKELKIELPSKKELQKIINSAHRLLLEAFYRNISNKLPKSICKKLDHLISPDNELNDYRWIKSPPGKLGMNSILHEIEKLNQISDINLDKNVVDNISPGLLKRMYRRISCMDKRYIRDLSKEVRYSLLSIFLYKRKMVIIDNIIDMFVELIRKMEKKVDETIKKDITNNVRRIFNKEAILRKLTLAIIKNPKGTIEDVILTHVDLNTLKDLAFEFEGKSEETYNTHKSKEIKNKYSHFYRRMIKPILDRIKFKTNNKAWKDLVKSIELIHKYIATKHIYYPEDEEVPIDLLSKRWKDVINNSSNGRIKKHYFELGILEKIEKAIKCKEIYIEDSFKYRNPDKDLPADWEEKKDKYYIKVKAPFEAHSFIDPIEKNMLKSLLDANSFFEKGNDVYIYNIKNKKRGFFHVPKIEKQTESKVLKDIKNMVIERFGIVDLLDVLLEADNIVNFSKYFYSTDYRQNLNKNQIRERLLLTIFSLGTNIGLKRVHKAAKVNCSYQDLQYFQKRFLNPDSLRESIIALTNRILQIRNPLIWITNTVCVSDGKQFESWDQNLMAGSNPHYNKKGIMVYWHVDTNSTCIYSQIKHTNSSEVSAMIEGLIKHETEMSIKSNYVDSNGQTEIAFAFCHFLGVDLLPRLKRIKHEKLFVPNKHCKKDIQNLKSVINDKPINWKLIYSQYDEMVKHVAAILTGIGPCDSILRRFTSYNDSHPTYKAFKELGRALKTIFLCRYFTDPLLRLEIHEGLNIVEFWNSVNNFIFFGKNSKISSNDLTIQEMSVLCLHLLQNSIILSNTMMIDKVVLESKLLSKMTEKDLHSITPLYTSNINPYGDFILDFNKKSILEAA